MSWFIWNRYALPQGCKCFQNQLSLQLMTSRCFREFSSGKLTTHSGHKQRPAATAFRNKLCRERVAVGKKLCGFQIGLAFATPSHLLHSRTISTQSTSRLEIRLNGQRTQVLTLRNHGHYWPRNVQMLLAGPQRVSHPPKRFRWGSEEPIDSACAWKFEGDRRLGLGRLLSCPTRMALDCCVQCGGSVLSALNVHWEDVPSAWKQVCVHWSVFAHSLAFRVYFLDSRKTYNGRD